MRDLPFISTSEFHDACQDLYAGLHPCAVDCRYVVQDEHQLLIIRQNARDHKPDMSRTHYEHQPPPAEDEEEVVENTDPARLDVWPLHPWTVPVEYHIMLSPTYRVPVLYFQALYPLDEHGPPTVSSVLERLVPETMRTQVESVGLMGGISMTNHPMTGLTWFFIHPCNTPDALREVLGTRNPSPCEYLQIWLGLVGPTVGFSLPKEVVTGTLPD